MALIAAAPACATVSGISFGPWHTPERNTPAVGDSTGRSFGVSLGEEVVGIDAGGQHSRNAAHVRVRLNRRCEDDHIRFHQDLLVVKQVNALHKQLAVRLRHDLTDLTLDVVYAVIFHGATVELIEVLTGGTHVDVNTVTLTSGFITDQHGVLCRVHAANLGAIALPRDGAAAAYTLMNTIFFRVLAVGKALQMTLRGGLPRS